MSGIKPLYKYSAGYNPVQSDTQVVNTHPAASPAYGIPFLLQR